MNDDTKPVLQHLLAACQSMHEICVELVDQQDARVVNSRLALAHAEVAIAAMGKSQPFNFEPDVPPDYRLAVLSKVKMPFGDFKAKALDEVPLPYLDRLVGWSGLYGKLKQDITDYLAHPTIAKLLEQELARKERG